MRVPSRPQSYLRYPLSRILASAGAVRVLRALARHGGELSIPMLVRPTGLSTEGIRNVLRALSAVGVVESLGQGRSVLYRLRRAHPLYQPLSHLFEAEDARARRVFGALHEAAQVAVPDALAVWVYGSTARGEDAPGSDLDVALVVPRQEAELAAAAFREQLAPVLDREQVTLSAIGLSGADVRRLAGRDDPWWRNVVADAQPVLGPAPAMLAERLDRAGAAPVPTA